jgi:ribosomal protein S18 acetylase RimI-like enzyme
MLDEAMAVAAHSGFSSMWLCVWERNARARAFYAKAGFKHVGEVEIPMNGVPFQDLVMQRDV